MLKLLSAIAVACAFNVSMAEEGTAPAPAETPAATTGTPEAGKAPEGKDKMDAAHAAHGADTAHKGMEKKKAKKKKM